MAKRSKASRAAGGPRGYRGSRGRQGSPGIAPEALQRIIDTLEALQDDAGIQFRRIAQLQTQLDETLKALKEMGEKAGRQRKKR
jgi:hypothetical protein